MAIRVADVELWTFMSGCRQVFVTSGGTVYAIAPQNGYIRCYKKTDGAFAEQDAANAHQYLGVGALDCRCDGTIIHIAKYTRRTALHYLLFDTSTDTWGAVELIDDAFTSPGASRCAISLDSNNKPHVVYTAEIPPLSAIDRLGYKNRVGAGWSAREVVSTDDTVNNERPSAGHESDDRFVVAWLDITNSRIKARTRSSGGVWDTEGLVRTGHTRLSLAIDSGDNKHVAVSGGASPYYLYSVEGTSGANPSWTSSAALDQNVLWGPSNGCRPTGTDCFVVYHDEVLHDILMVERVGGAWKSPRTLQEGTLSDPIMQNPAGDTTFGYVFKDDVEDRVYWDEYTVALVAYNSGNALRANALYIFHSPMEVGDRLNFVVSANAQVLMLNVDEIVRGRAVSIASVFDAPAVAGVDILASPVGPSFPAILRVQVALDAEALLRARLIPG